MLQYTYICEEIEVNCEAVHGYRGNMSVNRKVGNGDLVIDVQRTSLMLNLKYISSQTLDYNVRIEAFNFSKTGTFHKENGHGEWCTVNFEVCPTKFTVIVTISDRDRPTKSNLNTELFENRDNCDVVAVVQGERIPVHKMVLTLHSPVFEAMFNSSMLEATTGEIEVTDCTVEVFNIFLKYLYTCEFNPKVVSAFVSELLTIAAKYQVTELLELCSSHLKTDIDIQNAINIWSFADLHDLKEVKDKVTEFIKKNLDEIISDTNIVVEAPELLRKILVAK